MVRNQKTILILALTLFAAMVLAPISAFADQNSKNNWRNLGIGAGAVGVYGLATHNSTLGVIGLAGAGYSAYRYEQDRHHQSQERDRARYYHRSHWHPGYRWNGVWHNGYYER